MAQTNRRVEDSWRDSGGAPTVVGVQRHGCKVATPLNSKEPTGPVGKFRVGVKPFELPGRVLPILEHHNLAQLRLSVAPIGFTGNQYADDQHQDQNGPDSKTKKTEE